MPEDSKAQARLPAAAGVGYKAQHFAAITDNPGTVAWLEIHAENYMGDGGRPLGIVPNILLVPPSLEAAARAIVETQFLPGGGSNPNFNTAKVVVNPWAE